MKTFINIIFINSVLLFVLTIGLASCTGSRFKNWQNNILVGSLRFDYVERIVLDGHKVSHQEKLVEGIGRVRNVVMSPDGLVYIGLENPGRIVRLIPVE